MTKQQKLGELLQIAKRIAVNDNEDTTSIEVRSRVTYKAAIEYRRLHGKRPNQEIIDIVRFQLNWSHV